MYTDAVVGWSADDAVAGSLSPGFRVQEDGHSELS